MKDEGVVDRWSEIASRRDLEMMNDIVCL